MARETKNDFYKFGILMAEDSKILYKNNRLHNSVYFALFALEAYWKIRLIMEGKHFIGHINDIRIFTITDTDLFDANKFTNMIYGYDINDRYKVDEWIDVAKCANIQTELIGVEELLYDLRMQGKL